MPRRRTSSHSSASKTPPPAPVVVPPAAPPMLPVVASPTIPPRPTIEATAPAKPSQATPQDDTPHFESLLQELETLVERLERNSVSLADSLAAFERGMSLVRRAEAVLQGAERRVEQLLEREDGTLVRRRMGETDVGADLH